MAIQNQPDRHPINCEDKQELVALPTNHFNYNPMKKYHLGATMFQTIKQLTDFQNEMANFPGNPFPGMYVRFELRQVAPDTLQEFLKKGVELLQVFGKHVQVLDLEIEDMGMHAIWKCVNQL